MKTEQIIKKIKSIPGGRFFRVRYISKVKMAADAEQEGISIFKIVDTTTRTGVKYNNIEGVTPTTYPEDKERVKREIRALIDRGEYPEDLWA